MRRSHRKAPPPRTPEERKQPGLSAGRRACRAAPARQPPAAVGAGRARSSAPARRDVEPAASGPSRQPAAEARAAAAGRARNTAIFSVLTGLSRVAGLVREIVAAATTARCGAASAFTLAFQVPNLIRALVADAALSVGVRARLLRAAGAEAPARGDARASALAGLLLLALTTLTLLFILVAPWLMPLFTGDTPALDDLTVGLSACCSRSSCCSGSTAWSWGS